MKTTWNLHKFILSMHYILFDDKDSDCKLRWLEKNKYKKMYWYQWISLEHLKTIYKKHSDPEINEIAEWMIRERTIETTEKKICFNPRAFCWASGKNLFLKPAIIVHTIVTGPGDPLKENFYFSPKQYTMWLLKQ